MFAKRPGPGSSTTLGMADRSDGPELRTALITVLELQNRAYRKHSEMQHARRRDPEVERAFWGEGYIGLADAVVRLRHPETTKALAGALTIGEPPARYLAKFGEEAALVAYV